MKKAVIAAACIACAAAITLCGCARKATVENDYGTFTDDQYSAIMDYLEKNDASDARQIAAASASSVLSSVSIYSVQTYRETSMSGSFMRPSYSYTYIDYLSYGSGVIVDLDKENGDAYILTCCHLIYDDSMTSTISQRVYMYLYGQDIEGVNFTIDEEEEDGTEDGATYSGSAYYKYVFTDDDYCRMEGTVVAASTTYDLALIKVTGSDVIKKSGAVAADFAEDDEVYIGRSVYAVGNSLGEGTAVTTGSISKDSYEITYSVKTGSSNTYRVIQTDAAVNSGNGGGALYNLDGEIIGIVNDKDASGTDNIGYALAGSNVKRICQLMLDTASDSAITRSGISRGYLKTSTSSGGRPGWESSTNSGSNAGYEVTNTSSVYDEDLQAARIKEVVSANTAAYGLQDGDIITHLLMTDADGNTVEDLDITRKYLLDDALISYRSGYTVTLTYIRTAEDGSQTEGTQNVTCQMSGID